jgi:hypothetical protein
MRPIAAGNVEASRITVVANFVAIAMPGRRDDEYKCFNALEDRAGLPCGLRQIVRPCFVRLAYHLRTAASFSAHRA